MDNVDAYQAFLLSRTKDQGSPPPDSICALSKHLRLTTAISLNPYTSSESLAKSKIHWYCSNTSSSLETEIATYLLYFFSFIRKDEAETFLVLLEKVVLGCAECARGFCIGRRKFAAKYINNFPVQSRAAFNRAVDDWQAKLIHDIINNSLNDSDFTNIKLDSAHWNLILGPSDGSIYSHALIKDFLLGIILSNVNGTTDTKYEATIIPSLVELGLTPGLLLLAVTGLDNSEDTTQKEKFMVWANKQIQGCAKKPLGALEWHEMGFSQVFASLFESTNTPTSDAESLEYKQISTRAWFVLLDCLEYSVLSRDCVNNGILEQGPDNLLKILIRKLSDASELLPLYLRIFATLLKIMPTATFWTNADPSPELPSALWADLQHNPAFVQLLQISFDPTGAEENPQHLAIQDVWRHLSKRDAGVNDTKGKGRESLELLPVMPRKDWSLSWLTDFLVSLRDLSLTASAASVPDATPKTSFNGVFEENIGRVANFCLESLQHPRFSHKFKAKAFECMTLSLKIIMDKNDLEKQSVSGEARCQAALSKTLDINASMLTGVVLNQKDYPEIHWSQARKCGLVLLYHVLMWDGDETRRVTTQLGRKAILARKSDKSDVTSFLKLTVHSHVWDKVYQTSSSRSVDGIGLLMRGLVRFAHIADPAGRAWGYEKLDFWKDQGDWSKSVLRIVRSMKEMKAEFGRKLSAFSAISDMAALQSLWSTNRIPETIIRLLLSPDEGIHNAVIGFIQQTFVEVEDRADCIKALVKQYPGETMAGLVDYLIRWKDDINDLPTAVESARWLVRCFTDIIEVLCRQGLLSDTPPLKDPVFLQKRTPAGSMADIVLSLWRQMNDVLSLIYRKTSSWAEWYENEEMVDWMQDALIFGRLLLEETRTFEMALSGAENSLQNRAVTAQSPRELSVVGTKLMAQLERVLESLTRWLSITETGTLYQAFELVKQLLAEFQRHTRPQGPALSPLFIKSCRSLEKYCRRDQGSTDKGMRSKGPKTKLTEADLSELSGFLRHFIEAEADVVIVERPNKPEVDSSKRNAFAELMKGSGKPSLPESSTSKTASRSDPSTARSKVAAIEILDSEEEDEFGDDPFAGLTAAELDQMETKAAPGSTGSIASFFKKPTGSATAIETREELQRRLAQKARLRIDVTPQARRPVLPAKPKGLLGQIRQEVRHDRISRPVVPARQVPAKLPQPRVIPRQEEKADTDTSDSSSEEEGGGLNSLMKLQHRSPVKEQPIMKMQKMVPVVAMKSKAELQREAALRTQRRLKPDMNWLYTSILGWDPQSRKPLNIPLKPIGHKFTDGKAYHQAITPLFLQVLWDDVMSSFDSPDGSSPSVPIQITSRYIEDSRLFLEMSPVGQMPFGWFVNDMDLCVLSSMDNSTQLFVKIEHFKRSNKTVTIKLRMSPLRDVMELKAQSKWIIRKHMNLTTANREFAALKGLPYYEPNILSAIMRASPAKLPAVNTQEVATAMRSFNLNEPQARAVLGSMQVEGFALIQGPPGTGKTKTISGLAGKFLSERVTNIRLDKSTSIPVKLMVCAPSNAAIDEVTRRLKDGVPSGNGKLFIPKIVRIGAEFSMNSAVKDVSLDSLVEARVTAVRDAKGGDKQSDISRAEQALEKLRLEREVKVKELGQMSDDHPGRGTLEAELQSLVSQRMARSSELTKLRDAARDHGRHIDAARREAREKVLEEADIICATLSGAGHESLAPFEFGTVIIDEAAQAIELSTLIPLKYKATRCILVGDPKQLPPTVTSKAAEEQQYNESLFVRLCKDRPDAMHLLSIQYRMHPDISRLPSKIFYDGKLADGPNMAIKTQAEWHATSLFGTYRFFDVNGAETSSGTSYKNVHEANAIVSLYRGLKQAYGQNDRLLGQIGVIATYKGQINELKKKFSEAFGNVAFDDIDFNTVDGFQGQEKSIIILSTTRSSPITEGQGNNSIGFLKDQRRMNVALTRAKSSLFIFGNAGTLERGSRDWKEIVGNARERRFFVGYSHGMFINPGNYEMGLGKPVLTIGSSSGGAVDVKRQPIPSKPRQDRTPIPFPSRSTLPTPPIPRPSTEVAIKRPLSPQPVDNDPERATKKKKRMDLKHLAKHPSQGIEGALAMGGGSSKRGFGGDGEVAGGGSKMRRVTGDEEDGARSVGGDSGRDVIKPGSNGATGGSRTNTNSESGPIRGKPLPSEANLFIKKKNKYKNNKPPPPPS